jgi:hypothetical protein
MKNIGFVVILFLCQMAQAAVVKPKIEPQPAAKILEGEGVTFGGLAGTGFTLTDLRRTADPKKKLERIVIDVGDLQGAPIKGWPGFYHAELKKNPGRLVIDFAQMPNSFIDQSSLAAKMSGSLGVSNTSMSMDPIDSSLNITMDLKKKTKVKVYQVSGKSSTSKVVIDLFIE